MGTRQRRNGFDTTNFSAQGDSLGNSLNEDNLKKTALSLAESPFLITSRLYDGENQCYFDKTAYYALINREIEAFCVFISDTTQYSELTKEVLLNFIYFTIKSSKKSLCIMITRKNKDYVKLLQGLLAVGFKSSQSTPRYTFNGQDYRMMEMELTKKIDDVQEIDF